MKNMLVVASVLAGCGNHSTGPTGPAPTDAPTVEPNGASDDVTPPRLVSVTPSTEVWIHDRFAIQFSEPVAAATITPGALRLRDGDRVIATAISLSADGTTAYLRAVHPVAAIGTVELVVGDTITDLAGNPFAGQTVELALAPWSKPSLELDDGGAPSLAVTGDDVHVASSLVIDGVRRIVVVGPSGARLGDPLGSGASAPTLAPGPVVAWVEGQTIAAARWDGSAWVALPSPGTGARPVLAASPAGDLALAWVESGDLRVARLVGDAWVGQTRIAATVVADPALAMSYDGTPIAAFVDRGSTDRIRVATLGTPVVELSALALFARPPSGTETHLSLAARNNELVLGWDESSGYSLSAHVALRSGSGWTVLPTLDVDAPDDARDTAVGIDADGAPIAAWTERIEGVARGFVARFDGTSWVTIGGDAWSGIGRARGPRLALWHDRVPVIAYRDDTGIELARFNGPSDPRLGLTERASIAGCAVDPAMPPAVLSATGCFTIAGGRPRPHPGLVPYDLRSELWSDGAIKRRWLGLPDGGSLIPQANGSLDAPPGTLIVKEFGLDDPADRTVIETRFLIRTPSGWTGLTYQWRFDGSDADLVAANASPIVSWGDSDHQYPDRATCLRCHNSTVGQTLGLRRDQLARRFDYDGVLDDQPRVLARLGILDQAPVTPIPAPHDPRVSIEQRVRGYIAANCAHCHNPSGECAPLDFRLATPLANTQLCDKLVPGDPASSRVFQLISSRPGMPAAGSLQTDPMFVDLMRRWISSMTSCP